MMFQQDKYINLFLIKQIFLINFTQLAKHCLISVYRIFGKILTTSQKQTKTI